MVPPHHFRLKEMKGGRSGVSLRAANRSEDGGAPRRLERRPPSSKEEDYEA